MKKSMSSSVSKKAMTEEPKPIDDLVEGLSAIAKIVGLSNEGVGFLWREGRLPVVRIGSCWIANISALDKAAKNDAIRVKPGRKKAV